MTTHPAALFDPRPHSQTGLCINLLGGPYLTVGGQRVEIPEGSKRLLAYVALRGGRVERRLAAGTLWPDNDDLRAAGNLRSALWRLNGPGCNVLEADKVSLWLPVGTVVDVDVMNDWAERLIAGTPSTADLCPVFWRTEFVELLPGWYDDWALFERERIRQLLLHALEELARRLVDQRRAAEAVGVAMTAVAAEPLRESAQRVLIETHLAEGNVVEARRAFDAYQSLVHRELGVAPGRDLRQLAGSWTG